MMKQLMVYQKKHLGEMLESMRDLEEEFRRCGDIFTAALLYGDGPLRDAEIRNMIRSSDRLHRLEENLLLLFFNETTINGGIVATEKLLLKVRSRPDQGIYAAVVESSRGKEGTLMIHQLFNILEFAVEHHHVNEVLDSSYLDSVY